MFSNHTRNPCDLLQAQLAKDRAKSLRPWNLTFYVATLTHSAVQCGLMMQQKRAEQLRVFRYLC